MKYEKPEIASVHSAIVVVQSGMKFNGDVLDSIHLVTNGAYEADE